MGISRTGRTGFRRKDKTPAPEHYKNFLITFSVNRYSVLAEASNGTAHFHSLKEFKSQALADVKKQIDKHIGRG